MRNRDLLRLVLYFIFYFSALYYLFYVIYYFTFSFIIYFNFIFSFCFIFLYSPTIAFLVHSTQMNAEVKFNAKSTLLNFISILKKDAKIQEVDTP